MPKCNNESLYKFFYLIRSTLPSSKLFYILFFSFKFIGLFLSTHDAKRYETDLITISSLLHRLTLFGFSLSIISQGYFIASLILFILLVYITLHLVIIYLQLNHLYRNQSLNQFDFLLNKKFISRRYKIYIRIIGIITLILLFFSNYLQEYLSFVVFYVIYRNNIHNKCSIDINTKCFILNNFTGSAVISPIALCVINLISLVILNCLLFAFLLLNSTKTLWLRFGFNGYSNKVILLCFMIFFWFQSLNSIDFLFAEDSINSLKIIIDICAVALLSLLLLSHMKYFNHYHSVIPQFNLFICVWCWYSGLLEIVIYYLCDRPLTQTYSYLKLIMELTNGVLFTYIILMVNNRHFLFAFGSNLFNSNQKHIYIGESFEFIYLLTSVLNNKLPQHLEVVSIINNHKSKCITQGCPCSKLLIDKEPKKKDKEHNKGISFKEMMIIIGEQDIVSRIYHLYKKNKNKSYPLEDYCVLHCGFIYSIKQHRSFALYLASKYLNSKLKLGLLSQYFLYEIKKQIIHEVFIKQKTKYHIYNLQDDIRKRVNCFDIINKQNEYNVTNANLKSFYDYINFIDIIKNLMIVCLNGLESILAIRSSLNANNNAKLRMTMDKRQYEHFIGSCEQIKMNNDKLKMLITKQMKGEVLNHSELSYLLTNYFDLLYKKLPNEIKCAFVPISNIDDIPKNEYLKDYLKYDIKSPLILKFTHNDAFVIDYISNNLCDKLGYKKGNLLGKDIHDYIPVEIVSIHKLFMKQFLFITNPSLNRDTFILNAEQNLVNIQLNCKVLPDLTNPFYIIIDAKIINHKSPVSFIYFLMLDHDLKILAVNKRFEEQFFFNIKMIDILKVNYCGFFGLNQAKFLKKTKEFFKKCKYFNLEEESKAISIIANIKQDKLFSYRKMKKDIKSSKSYFEDIIDKQKFIDCHSVLIKIVNDLGLDIEWYNRVRHLNERIKISLEQIMPNQINTYYKAIYHLRQIGTQRYYIVKLIEFVNVEQIIANTLYLYESLVKQKVIDTRSPMKAILKLSSRSLATLEKYKANSNIKNIKSLRSDSSPKSYKPMEQEMIGNSSNSTKYHLLQKKALNLNINNNRSIKQDGSISTDNNFVNSTNTFTNWSKKKNSYSTTTDHNATGGGVNKSNTHNANDFVINESKRLQMYVSYNRQSKRLTVLFYGILIVLLVLICSFIILKYTLMHINKSLFNITIYSSMVNTDILFGALLNIDICYQIDSKLINDEAINSLNERYIPISNDLIQHYSVFTSYLNGFVSKDTMKPIFNIINIVDSYKYLQDIWIAKPISSSLTELIYLFRILYSQNIFNSKKSQCRLKEMFYSEKYKLITDTSLIEASSIEERMLFFNLYNLMNRIKPKFDLILQESAKCMFDSHNSFSTFVVIYSIVLWVVTMVLLFVLINKVIIDQRLTKTICSYIYTQNNQEELDEQKLIAFRDIVMHFSKKRIKKYESIKGSCNDSCINNNQKYSKRIYVAKTHKHSNNELIVTSGSVSLVSASASGAFSNISSSVSASPLKQVTRQSIFNKSIRLQMTSIPKENITMKSNVLNIEIIIIICMIILITAIELTSVLLSLNWEFNTLFNLSLSIDFLERIPITIELLLYSMISVIVNDIYYIRNNSTRPSIREQYLNYYKKPIDIRQNTQVNYFNDSLYSSLYYEVELIEETIKEFANHNGNSLGLIREWEKRFNEKNGICVYGIIGANHNEKLNEMKLIEYYTQLSQRVEQCRIESESVSVNDFSSSIQLLIQELTNAYYDFATSAKEGINTDNSIDWFLSNQTNYIKTYDKPLKLAFETYSHFLLKELTILHDTIISNDLLISFILLISLLIIFAYSIIGIIKKSDHYKDLLIFFVSLAFSTLEIDLRHYDE